MAGMLILFLSPSTGIIAKLVRLLGFKLPNLMGSAKHSRTFMYGLRHGSM